MLSTSQLNENVQDAGDFCAPDRGSGLFDDVEDTSLEIQSLRPTSCNTSQDGHVDLHSCQDAVVMEEERKAEYVASAATESLCGLTQPQKIPYACLDTV